MSLPPDAWEALRLDPEVVAARAEFYRNYAIAPPSFDPRALVWELRQGRIGTDNAVVSINDLDGDRSLSRLRDRLTGSNADEPYEAWVRPAERADALRQTAIAQLLYDTGGGAEGLLRSGRAYRSIGLPFGLLLESAITGGSGVAYTAASMLSSVVGLGEMYRRFHLETPEFVEQLLPIAEVIATAAQQVAALLALVSNAEALSGRAELGSILRSAPSASSASPVGSTGQSAAIWWECGILLSDMANGRHSARGDLRAIVSELGAIHGMQLRAAQRDQFHWPSAATSVDLVDLHLACLVSNSARLMRQLSEPPWDLAEDFASLSLLSQVSIRVGLDLAGPPRGTATSTGGPRSPKTGPSSGRSRDGQRWR